MKNFKSFFKFVGYALTGYLAWLFVATHSSDLRDLTLDYLNFSYLLVLSLLVLVVRGIAFFVLFKNFGSTASPFLTILTVGKANLLNQIFPTRVGSVYLIHKFKTESALSYSRAVAIYSGSVFISLLLSILSSAVAFSLLLNSDHFYLNVIAIVGVVAVVGLAFFAVSFLRHRISFPLFKEILFFGSERPGRLFILYSVIEVFLLAYVFQISFFAVGIEISYLSSLFLSGARALSMVLAITPGAIGISEIFVGYSSVLLSLNPSNGAAAALLLRFVLLGWSLIFASVKFLRRA